MSFGPYDDFEECLEDNQDKDSPEAYCAALHKKITGLWPGETKKEDNNMLDIVLKLRKRGESLEEFIQKVRKAVYSIVGSELGAEDEWDMGVVWTFKDAVIVREYRSGKLYEIAYEITDDNSIELTTIKEVEEMYVQKSLAKENPRVTMKSVFDILESKDLDECYKAISALKEADEPDALYSYIHYKVNGEWPVVKFKKEDDNSTELTGLIVQKNKAKRIAYGAVLVPGEEDSDGEIVTKAKIEEAAHEWMESYRNVDLQHSLNNVGLPVESFILPMDMEVTIKGEQKIIPQGSWILASKFEEKTWKDIEDEKLTGYSVMGVKRATLEAAIKSNESIAYKKTLLKDLGPDWVAIAVSAVDEPAVPKAKFFALKSKEIIPPEIPEPSKTLFDRVKDVFSFKSKLTVNTGISENIEGEEKADNKSLKAGRSISDETFDALKKIKDLLVGLIDKGEKERKITFTSIGKKNNNGSDEEMTDEDIKKITEAVKTEIVKPLEERLEKVEKSLNNEADEKELTAGKEEENVEEEEETESTEEEQENEDITALKSEINELRKFKEAVEKKLGETTSKSIKGQDGDNEEIETAEKRYEDRDQFGRAIKKI